MHWVWGTGLYPGPGMGLRLTLGLGQWVRPWARDRDRAKAYPGAGAKAVARNGARATVRASYRNNAGRYCTRTVWKHKKSERMRAPETCTFR